MEVFAYGFMQNVLLAGSVVAFMLGPIGYFVVLCRAWLVTPRTHGLSRFVVGA